MEILISCFICENGIKENLDWRVPRFNIKIFFSVNAFIAAFEFCGYSI